MFEDASQYLQTWIPLFLYETYCQLISSKTNVSDQLQEVAGGPKNRVQNFLCTLKRNSTDANYTYLELYDKEHPLGQKDNRGVTKFTQSLDQLREFDLLLISQSEIDTRKQQFDSDFLSKMKQSH